jgi:hypothetical protein
MNINIISIKVKPIFKLFNPQQIRKLWNFFSKHCYYCLFNSALINLFTNKIKPIFTTETGTCEMKVKIKNKPNICQNAPKGMVCYRCY